MGFDFALTKEHGLLQQSVRKMVEQFAPHHTAFRQSIYKEQRFPEELWQACCDMGLMGTAIPEAYGGEGLGLLSMTIALEELSTFGFAGAMMVVTAMDACAILRHGSEDLKQRFLPKVATGELKLCFAHTEPDAGSNAFNTSTFARADGDEYILNGQKVFISGADVADYMLLTTRTTSAEEAQKIGNKAYGLSLFLVDTKAAGIQKQLLPMQGLEGIQQFALFFENVRVPAVNLLGQKDMGAKILFDCLNPERILVGGIAVGMVDFLLNRAVKYAHERKVFGGRPIGSYQAVAHPLAETKVEQEAARLLVYRSAWAFDQNLPADVVGHYSNCAKLKAADVAIKAADHAIETLGGYGFSEEYELIYCWNAARLLKTAPVTREMVLNYIAEHHLKLPRSY